MKGFRTFLMKGNVIDMAVAVVIGAAFVAVVNALVKDFFAPLIAATVGKADFSAHAFTINNAVFRWGDFVTVLITFILTAAVVYYLIVVPYGAALERSRRGQSGDPTERACPECLSEIPIEARRCRFCGQEVSAPA